MPSTSCSRGLAAYLAAAQPGPGTLNDARVHAQPRCNVERIRFARHPNDKSVGRGQLDLVKLHRGVLKAGVRVLEGCQGAAATETAACDVMIHRGMKSGAVQLSAGGQLQQLQHSHGQGPYSALFN